MTVKASFGVLLNYKQLSIGQINVVIAATFLLEKTTVGVNAVS